MSAGCHHRNTGHARSRVRQYCTKERRTASCSPLDLGPLRLGNYPGAEPECRPACRHDLPAGWSVVPSSGGNSPAPKCLQNVKIRPEGHQ